MTYWHRPWSMAGDTSPVKAPFSSWCMFWAPTFRDEPWTAWATRSSETKGGQRIFSIPARLSSASRRAVARAVAFWRVVFIFQLLATKGVAKDASYASLPTLRQAQGERRNLLITRSW